LSRYSLSQAISECRTRYHFLKQTTQDVDAPTSPRLVDAIVKLNEFQSSIDVLRGMLGFIATENPFLKSECEQAMKWWGLVTRDVVDSVTDMRKARSENDLFYLGQARYWIQYIEMNLSTFLSSCETVDKLSKLPLPEVRKEIQKEVERLEEAGRKLGEATKRYASAKRDLIAGFIGLAGVLVLGRILTVQTTGEISTAIQIAYLALITALAYAVAKGKIKSVSLG